MITTLTTFDYVSWMLLAYIVSSSNHSLGRSHVPHGYCISTHSGCIHQLLLRASLVYNKLLVGGSSQLMHSMGCHGTLHFFPYQESIYVVETAISAPKTSLTSRFRLFSVFLNYTSGLRFVFPINTCRHAIMNQSEARLHCRRSVHFRPSLSPRHPFRFFWGSGSETSQDLYMDWS